MSEVGKIKIAIDNPMDQILGNYGNASSKSNTNSSNTKMNAMKMESFDVSSFNFNNGSSIHEDFKIMSIDKSSLPSEEELEKYYELLNRGKSSLSQEEYLLYIKCYQYERNQELKSYQDLLKIVNEELDKKEEIRKACEDWKSSIEDLQLSTENYTLSLVNRYKEIASYENQKENELLNEELKKYELTITDIKNKSTEELIEILKNKNEEVKARYEEIENQNKFLNGYTKQETEFDNYEDFHNYVLEMDESKILLESAIKTTNKMIASAEYSHLNLLEDYQAYENKEEIVTSLEGYQNKDGVFYQNLSQIDALSRASEINPELGKVYNYLYETQGKEKANDYLKQMEETLNQINGQVNAEKFLSTLKDEKELMDYLENHIKVGGKGIGDGVGSFFEGIGDWLTGKDFYSESEYETMYILQALQEDSEKHYDWALQHNYNMTQSMGNMLPSIALSMLLTPVGGSVASTVGSVSMGVSAGGKSYHNALVEGHDTARSVFYGVLSGVSEAALQKLVGGIVGLSDVEVVDLKSLATSMLHEGLEEGSQEYLDALFKYGLWNEKQDFRELSKNAFVSAIYGSLTAGVMNGVGLGVNKMLNHSDAHVFGENLGENQISEEVDKLHSINEKAEVEILEDFETDSENIRDFDAQIYQEILNHNFEVENYVQERFNYMNNISRLFKFDLKTEFGKKVATIFEKVLSDKKVPKSIKEILKNLDSINNRFDNFRIESDVYNANTSFIYNMKGWLNQIVDPRIVMQTGELNSNVLLHEFGHALLHIFSNNVNPSNLHLIETESINQALSNAKSHVFNNINQIENFNNELINNYNNTTQATVKWFNEIRENENNKTKLLIENLYKNNAIEDLKKLFTKAVFSPNASNQIKKILSDHNLTTLQIDEVLQNQELMIEIAQKYHNIETQFANLNGIMSDFNYYGDGKKIISMISSVVESLNIVKEDGTTIELMYGHSKEYFSKDKTSSFDELFADFFSLNAHGRVDALNTFKMFVGNELYNILEQQLNDIASKMISLSNEKL